MSVQITRTVWVAGLIRRWSQRQRSSTRRSSSDASRTAGDGRSNFYRVYPIIRDFPQCYRFCWIARPHGREFFTDIFGWRPADACGAHGDASNVHKKRPGPEPMIPA